MSLSLLDRFTTAKVDVENFALITHAVPAERLREHVPERFEVETFTAPSGDEMGFISTSTFCNRQIHWSLSRYPAHDFDQSTFRTYVKQGDRRGAFFFGTYVSTRLSFVAQSLVAADTRLAGYDVDIVKDGSGYHRYFTHARTQTEELLFDIEATGTPEPKHPFETADEHAQFIMYRLAGFSFSPFGGVTYGPIEHRHLDPWEGRLLSGRFDFWKRRGLLPEEEWDSAYSVLVEPAVRFTLHPPRPAGP